MSRCFPFPPPGYEKKARPDDADLLKKEQHREKKHKKEKKDKEKREGKGKKEKDRSDGKHGEKKDRKEKHRDKKKDKEKAKDKDTEKSSTSDEKKVAGQFQGYNVEKLHQKEKYGKEKSNTTEEMRVSAQFEGCNGEKLFKKVERGKDKSSCSDEKKLAVVQFQSEMPIRNNLVAAEADDSKFLREFGTRIRDEEKGTGSQLVEGFKGTNRKKNEGVERFAVRDTGMLAEGKDKKVDNRKMDGQSIREESRFCGTAMVQNLGGMVQNKVEGMPRPMEKKIERRMEEKEKHKERKDGDKQGDPQKNKDRQKKQKQGKDKDTEKEKKKQEKVKEKTEHKKTEKDNIKRINKTDPIGALNNNTSRLSKDCDKNAATEGYLKKRKDIETNGFLHDDERPNKMPRPSSQNGEKLEPYQTPGLSASDRQERAANNLKVNGTVAAAQPLSVSQSNRCSYVITEAASAKKLPHPDANYLSQLLLSIPKMEWSDFDDQEWLFSSKDSQLKQQPPDDVGVNKEELRVVWAEALQIESADVCALPYVIPY